MFTGIIEEMGVVLALKRSGSSGALQIRAKKVLEGTQIGDSIAVNGVCLTVTKRDNASFTADVMPETLARSSLGQAKPGGSVNLERAMAAGILYPAISTASEPLKRLQTTATPYAIRFWRRPM